MEDLNKDNKGFKIFIIIFTLMVLIFLQEGNQERFIDFVDKLFGKNMELVLDGEYSGNNLMYFRGHVLNWEQNSLKFLDNEGKQKWVKDFTFQEPDILLANNYIYVIDKSTGDIYKVNGQGDTILRIELKSPVFNIKEVDSHLIAHIKGESEGLIILDDEGQRILDQAIDGNILTFNLNEDGSEYVYSTIKMDDRKITSEVFVNTIEGKDKYRMTFDNEIILYTGFIKNKLAVLTDLGLRLIQNGHVKWNKEYPLIKDIHIGDNRIYLLYGDNIEVMDFSGNVKNKVVLGVDYKKMVPLEKSIALVGNKNLSILQNGKEIIKYTGEKEIFDLRAYNNFIALHYDDRIEIHKIQTK